MDTYPWIEPGDEITCDLLNGMTGVHGLAVPQLSPGLLRPGPNRG